MKSKQSTIIQALLGLAALLAVALLFMGLARSGQSNLSPSAWVVLGAATVVLALAAFLPSVVLRSKSRPVSAPLSAKDIRLCVAIALVGSGLAVFGVVSGMLWLMMLGIMLAPLVFIFRGAPQP